MDVIVERPAALDVHKEQMTACVALPGADGKCAQEVRGFTTGRSWRMTSIACWSTPGT
jgi:hypothetical protein